MSTLTPGTPEQKEFYDSSQYWGNVHRIVKNLRAFHLHVGDQPILTADYESVDEDSFLNDDLSTSLNNYHLPTGPLYGDAWRIDRTRGLDETKTVAFVPKVPRWETGLVLVPENGGWHHLRPATLEETTSILGIARKISKARGLRPR